MKGLFGWVGFRRVALPYRRAPRMAGVLGDYDRVLKIFTELY